MNLFWDRQNHKMMTALTSPQSVSRLDLVIRDTYEVSLAVMTPQTILGSPYVAGEVSAGQSIRFGAKAPGSFVGGFLFSALTWVLTGSGTTARYTADLSLNTAALINAIGTSAYLDVVGEFVVIGAALENIDSTQVNIRVMPDVIRGTEGALADPDPPYATVDYVDAAIAGAIPINGANTRFHNGYFQVWNATQSKWHTLWATGAAGSETLMLGAGEA